ncbi:MAG: hydantoinase/oxoprolinase family protein [Clostridiales bacterium]|nr:hydantoinase/oxoprolinase family protein [Clostridiales bacterium]
MANLDNNNEIKRKVRVGIDVGGTNTKAVAIDNSTYQIIGVGIVPTSHTHELGVSAGVIESFKKCLDENGIDPKEVVFIAHSTTQATNALLEGDVAKVGIIGTASGLLPGALSKIQGNIKDIVLDKSGKRRIRTAYRYIDKKNFNNESVTEAVNSLRNEGCSVIAASKTFGVDNISEELQIQEIARSLGIEATCASEISKLYGLTRRTRTAVINSSILPKMIDTANSTEDAVRKAGITAPLMIMRGDGGVMDIGEMRKRPVLTMLSGPAASTVGALMYLKVSNGIFFEVGGTSTDIGVIKNGRPMIDYAVVGGQRTMVNSMDVHTGGVAGGSMIRAGGGNIIHVGPRSCHIANLSYVAFTEPEKISNPRVVQITPIEGDPSDYIAIETDDGSRYALTTTCAANALGYVKEGDYSYGYPESCKKAFDALGKFLGMTGEEAALKVLDNAAATCIEIIEELADKHKIERSQISLVGGGGGAKVLLPRTAEILGLQYQIADQAEIISSIGVALAMVRDTIERVIPNPTQEDILKLRQEATDSVIQSGATPDSVEIQIEIDTQSQKVRAIATGSTEIATQDLSTLIDEAQAKRLCAESMGADEKDVYLVVKNDYYWVFGRKVEDKQEIRIINTKGFIQRQRENALAITTTIAGVRSTATRLWNECLTYKSDIILNPDIYLAIGAKIVDFEGLQTLDQLTMLMDSELMIRASNEEAIVIAAKNDM